MCRSGPSVELTAHIQQRDVDISLRQSQAKEQPRRTRADNYNLLLATTDARRVPSLCWFCSWTLIRTPRHFYIGWGIHAQCGGILAGESIREGGGAGACPAGKFHSASNLLSYHC